MKKTNAKKKLLPAIGMLAISGAMLASSTFAWFTMNKTVSVNGMQLKAQAEKGLLINEKAGVTSGDGVWEEVALGGETTANANALRPTSTYNLTNWWHANSKKANSEAGAGSTTVDTDNTVERSTGVYYEVLDSIATTTVAATADTNAEKVVHYVDGTVGDTGYNNGEGYYVMYKYYLRSSGNDSLSVASGDLTATVSATLQDGATQQDLDKALRVGVKIGSDTKIFAPVAVQNYKVTKNAAGSSYESVTPIAANTATAINTSALTIPSITDSTNGGLEVDVYVWFEGEDTNCKSDNLTATLNAYDISIQFTDTALG